MNKPPWLTLMESYIGVSEEDNMAEIQQWIEETDGNKRRESWCADALNHCLEKTGFEGTHSPAAASFLKWGVDIGDTPQVGCIVVFQWSIGADAGGHHVSLYEKEINEFSIDCVGGNQNRQVKHSVYPVSDVLSYRMPKGYKEA